MMLAAVLAMVGAGVAPVPVAAAQCGSTQMVMGRWSAVDLPPAPSVPVLGASILSTSVVGQDPSVVLATDGVAVYRSTDGGCRWNTTYTLGPADYPTVSGVATAYNITNIGTTHSAVPAARQDVYLALSPNPLNAFSMVTLFGAAPPELVAVSHDGGQTFAVVPPAPSAANPIVPECLSRPTAFIVPPTDSRTIYMQCSGGLSQQVAEQAVAGGPYVYRSLDGGRSWSLMVLPMYGQYDAQWFVPGPKPRELWVAGQVSDGVAGYLAVAHTTDGGAHWTISKPAGKPGVGIGPIGVAVDMASAPGAERLVAYAPIGAFVSSDSGKHWTKLRGLDPTQGASNVALAFLLRHSVYVVAMPASYSCNKPGGVRLLRYSNGPGQPADTAFPGRWGEFAGWGAGDSFATLSGGTVAFGVMSFCQPATGTPPPPKLLSFRPS
jgi:hypothetical protein